MYIGNVRTSATDFPAAHGLNIYMPSSTISGTAKSTLSIPFRSLRVPPTGPRFTVICAAYGSIGGTAADRRWQQQQRCKQVILFRSNAGTRRA